MQAAYYFFPCWGLKKGGAFKKNSNKKFEKKSLNQGITFLSKLTNKIAD